MKIVDVESVEVTRVRDAIKQVDAGDFRAASRILLGVLCGRTLERIEDLAGCPPPDTAATATAWLMVGRLLNQRHLQWADAAAPPPSEPRHDTRVLTFNFSKAEIAGIVEEHDARMRELAFERAASRPTWLPREVVLLDLGSVQRVVRHYAAAITTLLSALDAGVADVAVREELLAEAALAIAEPDWDDDAKPDAQQGLARPEVAALVHGDRAYMPELYARIIEGSLRLGQCDEAHDTVARARTRFGQSPELDSTEKKIVQECGY